MKDEIFFLLMVVFVIVVSFGIIELFDILMGSLLGITIDKIINKK